MCVCVWGGGGDYNRNTWFVGVSGLFVGQQRNLGLILGRSRNLFLTAFRPAVGATLPPTHWVPRSFKGLKAVGGLNCHLTSSGAVVCKLSGVRTEGKEKMHSGHINNTIFFN